MPTHPPAVLLALACAASIAPLRAQCSNPNLGAPQGASDDSIRSVALGFPFRFPNGTTTATIEIDSNGRVMPAGGNPSDFTQSVSEFLTGTTALCVFWTDIDPGSGASDDLYFFTDGVGTAVITWKDVVLYGGGSGGEFTMQVVLRADHSFRFFYDQRAPVTDALTGFTRGGNAPNPGGTNLSAVIGSSTNTGTWPTLYENFPTSFDLQDAAFDFAPNGTGGYLVTGIACMSPPPASSRLTGVPCPAPTDPPVVIDWRPDGLGGYGVTASTATYDQNTGASMGHVDDSIRTAVLGFPFRMPTGAVVTAVDVDSNGRLLEVGSDGPDYSPSVAELLAQPGCIAPFWTDFDASRGGDIRFRTDGTGYAVVTWFNVPQFDSSRPLNVQIQLRGDASWTVVLENTGGFDRSDSLIIGCSSGGGAVNPGETDLRALPIATAGRPTQYELFDHTLGEVYDLQSPANGLALSSLTEPVIGGRFDLRLDNIAPSASAVWLMIGFRNLAADLSVLGAPCFLYSDNAVPPVPMVWGGPGVRTATYSIHLPATTAARVPLVLQGAVVNLGVNPLNVETSNAVEGTTGS